MSILPNDPDILVSLVNMKLRDSCSGLEVLCEELDTEEDMLVKKLAQAGYVYDKTVNRFRLPPDRG